MRSRFFFPQFLSRQLKVYANRYLLLQGVTILHLHSQRVMHFKSLRRAATEHKILLGFTGTTGYSSHYDWGETLRVYGILES